MNVRKLLLTGFLFVAFAVIGLVSQAQASKWGMKFIFDDTCSTEKAYDVVATPDGGSVVVGEYYGPHPSPPNYDHAYAARFDKCGKVVKSKWYYYSENYKNSTLYSVDRARGYDPQDPQNTEFYYASGNFYGDTGTGHGAQRHLFLVKLDRDLEVVWSKEVQDPGPSFFFSGIAVAAVGKPGDANADGGCTVVNGKVVEEQHDQDLWIIKFEEDGDVDATFGTYGQRAYGVEGDDDYEFISSAAIQTVGADGEPDGYIWAGYHGEGAVPYPEAYLLVIRIDMNGRALNDNGNPWSTWGTSGAGYTLLRTNDAAKTFYDVPWEIQQTSSGDFIIVGVRDKKEIRVIRLNNNGTRNWEKLYDDGTDCGTDEGDFLQPTVTEIADGNFVVAASRGCYHMYYPSKDWIDAWLFKVDGDGGCLWANKFGYLSDKGLPEIGTKMDDRFLGVDASIDLNIDPGDRGVVASGYTRGWVSSTDKYRNLLAMVDGHGKMCYPDANVCECAECYVATPCNVAEDPYIAEHVVAGRHTLDTTYPVTTISPLSADLTPTIEWFDCNGDGDGDCVDLDHDADLIYCGDSYLDYDYSIPAESDNCCATYNPNQRDTDNDGYGNMCDCDLNNDNVVNLDDTILLLNDWGTPDPDHSDFNGDGAVNTEDAVIFLERWLDTAPFE